MRVVICPSSYPPAIGGVESLTSNLAESLVERGHQVEVWTYADESGALSHENRVRVRRFRFPIPSARLTSVVVSAGDGAASMRRLLESFRHFRPDVLNVHCFSGNGVYATALSAITKVPLIVSLHGETAMDDADIYRDSIALRKGLQWGMKSAALTTACSEFALSHAEATVGYYVPEGKRRVISNGVPSSIAPGEVPEIAFDSYIAAIGRVVSNKGFDLLLEGYAKAQLPNVGLVIVGDGPVLAALQRRSESLVPGRVQFLGRLQAPSVATVMRGATACVMPSRLEPFGLVALEAWREGVPILASCHGGAGEFIRHRINGILVDPFDVTRLSSAIREIATNGNLRRQLIVSGRMALKGFTLESMTNHYETAYRIACR